MEQKQIAKLYFDDISSAESAIALKDGYQCQIGGYWYYFVSNGADYTIDHKEVLATGMGGDTRWIKKREDVDNELLEYKEQETPGTGGWEFIDPNNYEPNATGQYTFLEVGPSGKNTYINANGYYCWFSNNGRCWSISTETEYNNDDYYGYTYSSGVYNGPGSLDEPRSPDLTWSDKDYNTGSGWQEMAGETNKVIALKEINNIAHGDGTTLLPSTGLRDPKKELVTFDTITDDGYSVVLKLQAGDTLIQHNLFSKAIEVRVYDRDWKYIVVNHEVIDLNSININVTSTDIYRIVILKATKDFGQFIHYKNYNYENNVNNKLTKTSYNRTLNILEFEGDWKPDNYDETQINQGEYVELMGYDFGRIFVETKENLGDYIPSYYVVDAYDLTTIAPKTGVASGNDVSDSYGFADIIPIYNNEYLQTLERNSTDTTPQVVYRNKDTLAVIANVQINSGSTNYRGTGGFFKTDNYHYGIQYGGTTFMFKGHIDELGTRTYTHVNGLSSSSVKHGGVLIGGYYYCIDNSGNLNEINLNDTTTDAPVVANQYPVPNNSIGYNFTKLINVGDYIYFIYNATDGKEYLAKFNISSKVFEESILVDEVTHNNAASITLTDGFIVGGSKDDDRQVFTYNLTTGVVNHPYVEGIVGDNNDSLRIIGYTDI